MASSAYNPAYGVQSGPRTGHEGRLAGVGGNPEAAMGHFHPAASIPGGMTMPMTMTTVTADSVQVQEMTPIYAGPTAAPVPATGRGRWFQLHAAGRA